MKQLSPQFKNVGAMTDANGNVIVPSTFRAFARIKGTHAGKTSAAWHIVQGSRGAR
jgi:hypothetical protein